eukprot:CAMPEP_0171310260 /NCGR_PEP_ID=MMETSP0816-20121228/20471_1 /TAXON_ID=420281 /ORGANISM="Proboscia inermis, Strain CCAP1064/1" /LENGTH=293 /DNA_ID=CAMNT_0011794307 /DNA_START=1 /DNA_END=882 /DNA_ORIENTATION=+
MMKMKKDMLRNFAVEEQRDILPMIDLNVDDRFTVRIVTSHDRVDLVQNSIDSHALCEKVSEVQVDWKIGGIEPPYSIAKHISGKANVIRNSQDFSSATATDAVILVADDLIFTCEELGRAFSVWKEVPDRVVGFFPLRHAKASWEKAQNGEGWLPAWNSHSKPINTHGTWDLEIVNINTYPYSIVTNRALVLHQIYLKESPLMRETLQLLPTNSPCREIVLSLRITKLTLKPPVVVSAHPLELRSSSTTFYRDERLREEKIFESSACFSNLMNILELENVPLENITYMGNDLI